MPVARHRGARDRGLTAVRVGVVGCGVMGSGIAELCARSGLETTVVEVDASALDAGLHRVHDTLLRAVRAGRIDEHLGELAWKRLTFTQDLAELAHADLVVEAILESLPAKLALLARLEEVVAPDAILASNTSSYSIAELSSALMRPERFVGLHFFNPVHVRRLVEIVPSPATTDAVVARVRALATDVLGRVAVRAPDRAGFVVNALLFPYLLSAIRMYEAGLASAADIDAAMVEGCGHPIGPLALVDLVGLDTTAAIADSLHVESKDPAHACPPLLREMVAAGRLGRKAGQGFYEYTPVSPAGGAAPRPA